MFVSVLLAGRSVCNEEPLAERVTSSLRWRVVDGAATGGLMVTIGRRPSNDEVHASVGEKLTTGRGGG